MGRFLGRCPGFSCGSHTPNRLLGPWDGAQGFRAGDPKPLSFQTEGTNSASPSWPKRRMLQVPGASFWMLYARRCPAILELLACEGQTLLIRRDALLILDLGFYVVNGVGRLHVERDGLPVSILTKICIPPRKRNTRCRVAPFARPAHRRDQSPQRQRDLGHVEKPISLRCTSRSRPRRGGTQQAPSPHTRCAYSVKAAFAAGHPKTAPKARGSTVVLSHKAQLSEAWHRAPSS